MTKHGVHKGVFDISESEGVNESERILTRLCRRSFLSLWSHANLHTDQDMRDGKGSAKEFADVLVVFGDDVIIFSDKHIQFQDEQAIEVAWPRWYKRAIYSSAKQLYGAMSWLRRFPERIFLDSQCTRRFPVQIPSVGDARFHLVAVTRGSFDACVKHFSGSLGSHQIKTDIEGAAHEKTPFTVGVLDRAKHFVHVLDEFSLEVLMGEMDTITDFLEYLRAREAFLFDPDTVVVAAGEEQLIAAYLLNSDGNGHAFLPEIEEKKPDLIFFDESHYSTLKARPEYIDMRRQNLQSQFWDHLIEQFIRLGDPSIVHPDFIQHNNDTEHALRLMAGESRFRRRLLTESIRDVLDAAKSSPGLRRVRLFSTKQDSNVVYIFLVMPKLSTESYEDYRRHRMAMLHAYGRCAKLRFPDGSIFIVLGFDHPVKTYDGFSEDLFVFSCGNWDEEARLEAEKYRKEFGILEDNANVFEGHRYEFPQLPETDKASVSSRKIAAKMKMKNKNKSKIAKASRRRNR